MPARTSLWNFRFLRRELRRKICGGRNENLVLFQRAAYRRFRQRIGERQRYFRTFRQNPQRVGTRKVSHKTKPEKRNEPYQSARAALDENDFFTPNNTLALEYVHAMKKYGFSPYTIKREGSFSGLETDGNYASAQAIRNCVFSGRFNEIERFCRITFQIRLKIVFPTTTFSALFLTDSTR